MNQRNQPREGKTRIRSVRGDVVEVVLLATRISGRGSRERDTHASDDDSQLV